MEYISLIENLLKKGNERIEELEAFLVTNKSIEVNVFNGEVDKYSIAESGGLSLRGVKDGKMGYSYTEKLDESSFDMLINEVLENGKYIDILDGDEIGSGSSEYSVLDSYSAKLSNIPMEEKIQFAKSIEKEAFALDKRVKSVQELAYHEFQQERYIYNTKGVKLNDKINGGFAYISVIVKDENDTKTGLSFRVFSDLEEVSPKDIAKEAVENALSMLGASPISSGNYSTVIKNTTFADLLEAFSSIISADNAQKGLSLLKSKEGEKIASDIVTIVDNPYYPGGFASRAFDDEGTATKEKRIVDKGVLTTLLHTLKTSKKDGIESTGNGSRASYKSTLSIAPSNIYLEKGSKSLEDIFNSISHGVYITELQGLHSGLNPVSGDFSLSASGFEIVEGSIRRPINQITIAGNFYEVLKNIEEVGADLKFGIPGASYFGSPSVKIKSLSISG